MSKVQEKSIKPVQINWTIESEGTDELTRSDATLEIFFKENKLERTSVIIQNMSDMSVSVTELENDFEFTLSRKLKRLLEY